MDIEQRLKDIVYAYSPAENPSVFMMVTAFKKCMEQRDEYIKNVADEKGDDRSLELWKEDCDSELLDILCGGPCDESKPIQV